MSEERAREIIRQFPENGLKQVLSSAGNVRDLLALGKAKVLPRIDFTGMQVDPTTYVTAEYRHVSSDLVLSVALRPFGKGGRKKKLLLTILLELQSEPDRLMLLRVLEYLVQIWKGQVKRHGETHKSLASVKLSPVLPVVLHTGSFHWEKLGTLLDLMDDAEEFRDFLPAFQPLFVSLPDLAEAELQERGGTFGQVLAVVKARKSDRNAFAYRLGQTVAHLEELKADEQLRRLELLCYVEALVYHSRQSAEHAALRQRIDTALKNNESRLEVDMVRKTLADVHWEQATLAANKRMLIRQLQARWAPLPPETEQIIEATQDAKQLEEWALNFATAKDLDAVGIRPPR